MKWSPRFFLVLLIGGGAALQAQAPNRFAAYEHCQFADDLALVENTPLPSGVEGRTVKTIMGPRQVPLAAGTRLMFAYPHTDFFANVKVEQIPTEGYAQAKQDLVANFEQILTGDDSSSRNYGLKPRLNGLEIYGLDRRKLEGGVLGIYLFFVDRTHTATTIYFLNQDPGARKFDNLEDYAGLRDAFVNAYTRCAAGRAVGPELSAHAPIAPVTASPVMEAPAAQPTAAALPDAPGVPVPAGGSAPPAPEVPAEIARAASAMPHRPAVKATVRKTAAPVRASTAPARKRGKAPVHPAVKKARGKPARKPAVKKK